jgi:hypothetical protein
MRAVRSLGDIAVPMELGDGGVSFAGRQRRRASSLFHCKLDICVDELSYSFWQFLGCPCSIFTSINVFSVSRSAVLVLCVCSCMRERLTDYCCHVPATTTVKEATNVKEATIVKEAISVKEATNVKVKI